MTDHGPDEDLLARLRDADPAASLPAADPDRVARLLEVAMSQTTQPDLAPDKVPDMVTESRRTGIRGRSPLTWLVAAAALMLIAAAGLLTFVGRGDGPVAPPTASNGPTVTELTLPPTAAAGRCMVPNARLLATAAYAVEAEVVAIADGVVTLDPTHWYAGAATDRVRVDQGSPDLAALIGMTRFEEGRRYLVAGTGSGEVMVCGFSGPHTDTLAALYSRAFGS